MPPSTRLTRLASLGLPAVIAATALALVATAWSIRRGVDGASETLVRGQAQRLAASIGQELRSGEGVSADGVLSTLAAEGLTFVAIYRRDGELLDSAGSPVGGIDGVHEAIRTGRRRELERVGERIRVTLRRRGRRRPRRGQRPPGDPGPRLRARPPRGRGLAFEFRPSDAHELRARSDRMMGFGALAGGLLLAVAAFTARWLSRRERRQAELEQARRLAQLGEMSAVLAHEIRNPLASLKGNAELLERTLEADDRAKKRASRVVEEAARLDALTSDLLEFSRTGEIERSSCKVVELVTAAIADVGPGTGGVELSLDAAPESWSLDRRRMMQVLVNLIGNARDASGGGTVVVSARQERDSLIIEVDDSGPGIPDSDMPRLFDAFFTTKNHGTGLGLAVSRRLVELHGGEIGASNIPGGGARLRVRIPAG